MRYFIDHDQGDSIRGWIVPDNPLAISRVVVAVDGRRVAEVPASVIDEAFKRNGWHATGQCTFVVTEAEVPGLSEIPRLELYDADTNVLVYRRVPTEGQVRLRTMLINTGIEPEIVLQTALFPYFQHCYFGIHKLPDEILSCVLAGPAAPSALLSGAVTIPRYENFMTPDLMVTAILLQEPQIEMAARMRWLKARAADAADPARSWRLGPLAEAAAFADGYDFSDVKSLKRFFRMLPEPRLPAALQPADPPARDPHAGRPAASRQLDRGDRDSRPRRHRRPQDPVPRLRVDAVRPPRDRHADPDPAAGAGRDAGAGRAPEERQGG
ncbi:hypothetical protein ACU4GR_32260 [Methylobacterium oryzae CBMB20]